MILVFLLKGRTKIACDCLFNSLKLAYCFKDIFIHDQLYDTVNSNKSINDNRMNTTEFFDFLKQQERNYHTSNGVIVCLLMSL